MAAFEGLRARFGEMIGAMSKRDRVLFVGLVIGAYVVGVGGLWWLARGQLGDLQSRIDGQERNLTLLTSMADDQAQAADRVTKIDQQMAKYADQDLPAFVEKAAQKTGIASNLQGVREKQKATDGDIEETPFSVELSKVSLQQLTEFLYEIETAGYPLKVHTMKTRLVTVSGVKMLNVSMEIGAFRIVNEAAPTATEEKPG